MSDAVFEGAASSRAPCLLRRFPDPIAIVGMDLFETR
jgi:hypothetical protein